MTLYRFSHWEDGTTTPTRTLTVTSDITIVATYEAVRRRVGYESTPISISANIDTTVVPSGTIIEVEDGSEIVITVPAEVEV